MDLKVYLILVFDKNTNSTVEEMFVISENRPKASAAKSYLKHENNPHLLITTMELSYDDNLERIDELGFRWYEEVGIILSQIPDILSMEDKIKEVGYLIFSHLVYDDEHLPF